MMPLAAFLVGLLCGAALFFLGSVATRLREWARWLGK
jgi:hypothetical protein